MKNEFINDYKMSLNGRECWLYFKDKYNLRIEDYIILFPDDEETLNQVAASQLTDFLKRKFAKKALVLCVNSEVKKVIENFIEVNIPSEIISEKDMQNLLKYYRLVQFTKNIVIISTEEPFGNDHIIGKDGITAEDYIRDAIYV